MTEIFIPSVKKDLQELFKGAIEIDIRTGYWTVEVWDQILGEVSRGVRIRLIVGMLKKKVDGKDASVDLGNPQEVFQSLIISSKFSKASEAVLVDIANRIHHKKLEIRGHSDVHGAMYMGKKRFRRHRAFAGSVNFTWPPQNNQGNVWFEVRRAKTNRNLAKLFENDWGCCTDVSSLILEKIKNEVTNWKPPKLSLIKRLIQWLFRK